MRCAVCHSSYEPGPPSLVVRILVILGTMPSGRPVLPAGIRDRLRRDQAGPVPSDTVLRQTLRQMTQRDEIIRRETHGKTLGYQLNPATYGPGVVPTLDTARFHGEEIEREPEPELTISQAANAIFNLVHEQTADNDSWIPLETLKSGLVDHGVMDSRTFEGAIMKLWGDNAIQYNEDFSRVREAAL